MIYSSLPLSLSSSINYIMPFEILACGFNALGQLLPGTTDDIVTPTVIARAETSAKVLFAGWSETLRMPPSSSLSPSLSPSSYTIPHNPSILTL